MRVLVMADRYLPGYKSGGPIRSLSNLVARLGDEIDFRVCTRDRDGGDTAPYPGIVAGEWQPVEKARVRYLAPAEQRMSVLRAVIAEAGHDVLYLNSAFSPLVTLRTLALRRLGRIPPRPVVLAPRGELSAGALSLKSAKKRAWLAAARTAGLYRGVLWHATADEEAEEIRHWFGAGVPVRVVPNLGPPGEMPTAERAAKAPGRLRVVFLSRIARKKNLDVALRALARVRGGEIDFHVYGPAEDAAYWAECQALAAALPPHVRMEYRGAVEHARVAELMRGYDLFFLPTRGENFGHAIADALRAGTPVLIADTTPWRGLREAGAGWDLPADDVDGFARALEACAALDAEAHAALCRGAAALAARRLDDASAVDGYRALFRAAAQS
jgi:glycosyltransferase involved in cell wall biosynthesis